VTAIANRISQWTRLPPAQLWAEASRVLPPWVSLLLVVLIGWQLALLAWSLAPSDEPDAPPPLTAAARPDAAEGSGGVDIRRIVAAHLFEEATEEVPVTEEPVDAPETQLSLELRGTITATDADKALAIIAERGGDEKVFAVGDAVPGGASLHSVYTDRVILKRAGRLETLRLPRSEETGSQRSAAPARRASFTRPAPAQTVRDVVQQGSMTLTDIIRPQPVFKDGEQQGYRVYPGRQRQQFAQLGLRPGDLVTQINGMTLNDPARGMEIFRSLADATSVSVTVERNGQMEVLTLDTSTLQQAASSNNDEDE
jgi:general secretion pathway protein C